MSLVKSSGLAHQERDAALIAEAAERVGDGSQLQPEDFAHLTYVERLALHRASPEAYRNLRDGKRADGTGWRPAAGRVASR